MSLRKAVECVRRNKSFLITTHTSPEGDALGAQIALYRLLRKLGKGAVMLNEDDVPGEYSFLPHKESIKKYKANMKGITFDCLAVLDCSDLSRTGEVYRVNTEAKPVLNIDHHISNTRFADVNWVEPKASSCAEMIYKLYKRLRVPIDKISALCLYAGISTDTGSFRYSNTASSTHKAVAELLKYGLNVPQIYKSIHEDIPFEEMRLLARILQGMRREAGGRIIWFQLKHGLLRGRKLTFDISENILSFGRAIRGAEVVVLFKENLGVRDEIRVNFRSQGKVDVNKIAAVFGGGGHKTASGVTIRGKIDQVRREVIAKIKENLK